MSMENTAAAARRIETGLAAHRRHVTRREMSMENTAVVARRIETGLAAHRRHVERFHAAAVTSVVSLFIRCGIVIA